MAGGSLACQSPVPDWNPIPSQSPRANNHPGATASAGQSLAHSHLHPPRRDQQHLSRAQAAASVWTAKPPALATATTARAPQGRAWARLWHGGLCSRRRTTASQAEEDLGQAGQPARAPPRPCQDNHTSSLTPGSTGTQDLGTSGDFSLKPPRRAQRRDSRSGGGFLPRTRLRISYMPLISSLQFHLTPECAQTHRL